MKSSLKILWIGCFEKSVNLEIFHGGMCLKRNWKIALDRTQCFYILMPFYGYCMSWWYFRLKRVNSPKCSMCLDAFACIPGDLPGVTRRMTKYMEKHPNWKGLVEEEPSEEQLRDVLASFDLFLWEPKHLVDAHSKPGYSTLEKVWNWISSYIPCGLLRDQLS